MEISKETKSKIYNKVVFVLEFIICIILAISIFRIMYKYEDSNYISKPNLLVAILSGIASLTIIIINKIKYKHKIEKLFATFIIPVGALFVILVPPYCTPDEAGHLFRAYDLSQGNIITPFGDKKEGDIYVPQETYDLAVSEELTYSKIHESLQKETNYNNLIPAQTIFKTYFAINYIPGGIVFAMARLMNINFVLAAYIIKIINFILFILVGYFCIKKIPFGKLILAIYMFMPMIIQQATSLSADAVINNLSILFIVYNLKLLNQDEDLKIRQIVTYVIFATVTALCKYVYFPITFLSVLLINNKNLNKKKRNVLIIVSILISIVSSVGWFIFTQNYVDVRKYIKEANVRPIEQAKFIMQKPVTYLQTLHKTFDIYGAFYLFEFVGIHLGHSAHIEIPQIYILIMLVGLFLLVFTEKYTLITKKWQKILMLIISIGLVLLVLTGLYLTWSPLYYDKVAGVQGRYFIPIFIIALLALTRKEKNLEIKNIETKYFFTYLIINIITIIIMVGYY